MTHYAMGSAGLVQNRKFHPRILMRTLSEGKIDDQIHIAGHPVYPGYIVRGSRKSLMVEAGLNIVGPSYRAGAAAFLGNENALNYLLVTHGHYDHLGAFPYLKRNIPDMELRAHEITGTLLQKEKVLATMNFLSRQTWKYFDNLQDGVSEDVEIRYAPCGDPIREGDVIDLGGISCEVYETPGHTQDHLSFFLPEKGILFSGEALGNPIRETEDQVKIEFLSSYTSYINSIQKLMTLIPRVKILALSHIYYYTGKDVPHFMNNALRDTINYRNLIESYLDMENGDIEKAIATMLRVEYDEKGNIYQERNAYATNIAAQIKAVAAVRN